MNTATEIPAYTGLNITDIAKARYSAKSYDPSNKISDQDIKRVKELLQFSPSSTNAQPWHFLMLSSDEGKERLATANENKFPFNNPSIRNASHVVIFAARTDITEDYLLHVLAQEDADGRFDSDPETHKPQMHAGRSMFVNIHKELDDVAQWNAHQVYLNVGQFLLGVAALGIDATPMEGIDTEAVDAEFGLTEKGLASLVVVPIGYRNAAEDFNAALPKSRLPLDEILTEI
ncbi:oxygen-insensitive NAD(P)H nitroreductase [Celeribacter sp.]|uniref:oxygen-insensitive NAD(P)H nitroreductase n=1 Tax=Celeribacter sp. TaxID=1890673 RepID=UPI003A8C9A31